MMEFFDILLVHPILNLLIVIYNVMLWLHIPYTLGFAIVGLTIVIRFLLYPLIGAQLQASQKMQALNPHITNLKNKHKNDSKRIQEETMKLYKEHGVNPAAGCLPLLIQLPLIWALYGVLQKIVSQGPVEAMTYVNSTVYFESLKITHAWDPNFFGIPLGKHPSDLFAAMPLIVLVPVITGILQFVQAKMMIPVVVEEKGKKPVEKKQDDFATAFQTQSVYVFPIMIAFFSYTFPVGLSLYWNTFTLFGILQQYQISGWGSLTPKAKK